MTKLNIFSHDELLSSPLSQQANPLVDGMIDEGSFIILAGSPKAGKSSLVTNLSYAIANGTPFLGMKTTQGGVLWLMYEESLRDRARICRHYPSQSSVQVAFRPPKVDTADLIEELRSAISEFNLKLIVVDPLMGSTSCDSMTESKKSRDSLEKLNDLCAETGVTVLMIHHFNKGFHAQASSNRMSDSHQIPSICSQYWNLDWTDVRDGRFLTLSGAGRHDNGSKQWTIWSPNVSTFELSDPVAKALAKVENRSATKSQPVGTASRILRVMELGQSYSAADLGKVLKGNTGTVRNVLTRMVADGTVQAIRASGQQAIRYCLAESFLSDEASR